MSWKKQNQIVKYESFALESHGSILQSGEL